MLSQAHQHRKNGESSSWKPTVLTRDASVPNTVTASTLRRLGQEQFLTYTKQITWLKKEAERGENLQYLDLKITSYQRSLRLRQHLFLHHLSYYWESISCILPLSAKQSSHNNLSFKLPNSTVHHSRGNQYIEPRDGHTGTQVAAWWWWQQQQVPIDPRKESHMQGLPPFLPFGHHC